MQTLIVANILLILCAGALGFFFGPEEDRKFSGLATLMVAFNISLISWIIYVAQHFIVKYW